MRASEEHHAILVDQRGHCRRAKARLAEKPGQLGNAERDLAQHGSHRLAIEVDDGLHQHRSGTRPPGEGLLRDLRPPLRKRIPQRAVVEAQPRPDTLGVIRLAPQEHAVAIDQRDRPGEDLRAEEEIVQRLALGDERAGRKRIGRMRGQPESEPRLLGHRRQPLATERKKAVEALGQAAGILEPLARQLRGRLL